MDDVQLNVLRSTAEHAESVAATLRVDLAAHEAKAADRSRAIEANLNEQRQMVADAEAKAAEAKQEYDTALAANTGQGQGAALDATVSIEEN